MPAASPPPAALTVAGLSLRFGQRACLQDLAFTCAPGEWLAIVGPNGAGKTTLIRAILGLLTPQADQLSVGAHRLDRLSTVDRARLLAYVPQRLHSLPHFTVEDLVRQGRLPHRTQLYFESAEDRAIVERTLGELHLLPLRHRLVHTLSGGEVQRTLIAAALAQEPRFLLLDEPSSALDPAHAIAVFNLLDALCRQRDVGIVMVSHDINLATRYCDRLLLLVQGKVALDATPAEALPDPAIQRAFGAGLRLLPDPEGQVPYLVPASCRPSGPTAAQAPVVSASEGSPPAAAAPSPTPATHAAPDGAAAPAPPGLRPLAARQLARHTGLAALAALVAFALCPLFGPVDLAPSALFAAADDSMHATIFWQLRVPRVLLALLAGGALAMAGAAFQALLRNPLAAPYTLGVASGASLGALFAIQVGLVIPVLGVSPIAMAAFGGALVSTLLVFALARAFGRGGATEMLLAGITWSMLCSALGLLLQSRAAPTTSHFMVRWLMGGIDVVGYDAVVHTLPFVVSGLLLLLWYAPALNLLAVDEHLAQTRGVSLQAARFAVFAGASLATGAVVAQVGPIAFVGLLVPHAMRPLVGHDNRSLIPVSFFAGAAFLAVADTAARTLTAPNELPVGVLTALIGAPFLIALLIRQRPRA